MIADCDAGLVDMVITKSISRFARNTQDCLEYSRRLKELGIPIVFEKENINTMDASGELLFTILSSLAQEESRNISENCKWAIRHNFQKGKASLNTKLFMGYDMSEEGKLVINKEQAKIVKRIFREFEEGLTPTQIGLNLQADGVQGLRSNTWPNQGILMMLKNEKYCGDLLMQKTYTVDYLTKKKVRNRGEVEQYFIEGDHEAIIPKDEWLAVQMEIERREAYRQEVMTQTYGKAVSPFSNHLVCSKCGKVYGRCSWSRNGIYFWRCQGKRDGAEGCNGEAVFEEQIYKAFRIAWNSTCKKKGEYKERWDAMIKEGNPLERLRAKQMIELTKEGPVDCNVPELIRMVLERMIVISKTEFEVRLLDGTVQKVCVGEE